MLVILVLVVALWLNGRYQRSRWSIRPSLHMHPTTTGSERLLVIMWTGAFNDATIHFERLVPLYQRIGDVCVVRYADKRFDAHETMRVAYEYACIHQYDKIVLVGASLGGEEVLRFEEFVRNPRQYTGQYQPAIKKILCDVPLGGQHLPQPQWLLGIVKHVRIGPLFNLLSPIGARLMFRPLKPAQMNGVDVEHLARHMAAMWNCKLSVIAEQIAAITTQEAFSGVGAPAVYLRCGDDDVIDGPRAAYDVHALLGASLVEVINVEGGHVQFVENHIPWFAAHEEALLTLGYSL